MIAPHKTHDPLKLARLLWPNVRFYREQREIIRSVWEEHETYVYAGNMMGKDYVAGRLVILFFLTRAPCRIITTSTKDAHLAVLWGEIHRAIQESAVALSVRQGGNLIINQRELKKTAGGVECPISYVKGMVANEETMESFQGHHVADVGDGIPRTAVFGDEASSLKDRIKLMVDSWAKTQLWFGNTWPCGNFYYRASKRDEGITKFHIPAEASPNVRLARKQMALGLEPTGEVLIPGVKSWVEYERNRRLWDPVQQRVCLDAEFPEDERIKMYPPEWLDRAEELWDKGGFGSQPEAMGVDSAQGGDNTAIALVNRRALLDLESRKTADTTVIPDDVVDRLRRYPSLRPEKVYLDMGGGGKQHGDRLRLMGYDVRMVYFGSSATPEPSPGVRTIEDRMSKVEQRSTYRNKRAEMYALLRSYLNPAEGKNFALPPALLNRPRLDGGPSLREQMQAVPLSYDEEGRMFVIPKNRRDAKDTRETLTDIIGCSPDELDALVLAVYGLEAEEKWATVGVGY